MESIVEFALYTWVVVSILAVLTQLVRIMRHRRANAATSGSGVADAVSFKAGEQEAARPMGIDLEPPVSAPATPQVVEPVTASAPAAAPSMSSRPPTAAPAPPPVPDLSDPAMPPSPPAPSPPTPTVATPDITDQPAPPEVPEASEAEPSPPVTEPTPVSATLADLLAGVRLPWNLLPTVDHSHQPSNDRVALLTDEGEPADVGADVADELERLGFSIATRGEDTAIATRGDDVLGLRIIPDAVTAMAGEELRFPSATPASVALDIWIES